MKTKRHAKPTTDAMIQRIYRRQIKLEKYIFELRLYMPVMKVKVDAILTAQSRTEADIDRRCDVIIERLQHLKPVVDHCARLMYEKETLRKLVGSYKALQDANTFMSAPIRTQ